ncbi:TPA: hypothetical protein R2K44_002401 [Raoultella ornithinolytica]|nr:hypothetical protein [Raoultella ornithinolytica]
MDYWNKTEFEVTLKRKDKTKPDEVFSCFAIVNAFNRTFSKLVFDMNVVFFNGFKTNLKEDEMKLSLTYFHKDDEGSVVDINLSLQDISKYLQNLCKSESVKYEQVIIKEI